MLGQVRHDDAQSTSAVRATLVNPPTLFRWRHPSSSDEIVEPYYRRILRSDVHLAPGRSSTLPGEHLGLQSIAAALRSDGHEVAIVNGCARLHSSLRETEAAILSQEPDVVGFTGPADVFGEIRWIARALRASGLDVPFVLGNDLATLNAAEVLRTTPEFDFAVRGEGEATLPALLSALDGRRRIEDVPGLVWRRGDQLVFNNQKSLDLDDLDRPTRDDTTTVLANRMSASMFTKRGCPFRCSFCTTGQLGDALGLRGPQRWRQKNPKRAAEEFLELAATFGLEHITIVDDLFVSKDRASHAWASEFAQTLIDAGNTTTFMIDCRVDSVSRPLFQLLVHAGLRQAFLGIESTSVNSLKVFGKFYGHADPASAVTVLSDLGVKVIVGFIFFQPLATLQDLVDNAVLLRDMDADDFELHLQKVRVYPGTPLEELLRSQELIEGEFPFFSAAFADRHVRLVAEAMGELASQIRSELQHLPVPSQSNQRVFTAVNRAVEDLARSVTSLSRREIANWTSETARHAIREARRPESEVSL